MSVTVHELTDDDWTIAIPGRLALLMRISAKIVYCKDDGCGQECWVNELYVRGLLADDYEVGRQLYLTESGKQLVKMILATPLPRHAWIDPREVAENEVMG